MKKVALFCVILMFCVNLFSQRCNTIYDIKHHNFGVGLSSSLTATTNQYLQDNGVLHGGYYGKTAENLDLNFSLLYEYNLNRHVRFGVAPTYRYSWASVWYVYSGEDYGKTSESSSDIDIPLYVDYKLWWGRTSNVFLGTGLSGMFNIGMDAEHRERDSFSPYLMFRLGFETKQTHTLQFVIQYRLNLSPNTYYNVDEWNNNLQIDLFKKENFRLNTLDVGVNFFF
ncbi:MAG: hypothetical protein IJ213_09535 [Bacteroidales bacterium]|nr:hypothetical protein [Bacteroidales bacterium]